MYMILNFYVLLSPQAVLILFLLSPQIFLFLVEGRQMSIFWEISWRIHRHWLNASCLLWRRCFSKLVAAAWLWRWAY